MTFFQSAMPIPSDIEALLDWQLQSFTQVEDITETSKSPMKTRDSQRTPLPSVPASQLASSAAEPPQSATTLPSTVGKGSESGSTRPPAFFDMHMHEQLRLKRTTVLPALAHELELACNVILEDSPIQSFPSPTSRYNDTSRNFHFNSDHVVYKEAMIQHKCWFRQNACTTLFSSAMTRDGKWPANSDDESAGTSQCLKWETYSEKGQTKGIGDAFLLVNETFLKNPSKNSDEKLRASLQVVVDQKFQRFLVWEFKDLPCCSLPVMLAIRQLCSSKEVYPWIACHEHTEHRCHTRSCQDRDGKIAVTGTHTGFDTPMTKAFIKRCVFRQDIASAEYDSKIQIDDKSLKKARYIIQQIWAELVAIDGTFAVLSNGNLEFIGIRHRQSQALLISDLMIVPADRRHPQLITRTPNPPYIRVHTGLVTLAMLDVICRAKLRKAAMEAANPPALSRFRLTHTAYSKIDPAFNASEYGRGPSATVKLVADFKALEVLLRHAPRIEVRFQCSKPRFLHVNTHTVVTNQEPAITASVDVVGSDTLPVATVAIVAQDVLSPDSDFFVCRLAEAESSLDALAFSGRVATNGDAVCGLRRSYEVMQDIVSLCITQSVLGFFVDRAGTFGIQFCHPLDPREYRALPEWKTRLSIRNRDLIQESVNLLHSRGWTHNAIEARSIFIKTKAGPKSNPSVIISDWVHATRADTLKIAEENKRLQNIFEGLGCLKG